MAETDLRVRVARAIWDAMVDDEPPDEADLGTYGYIDAADAAISLMNQDRERYIKALGRIASGPNDAPYSEPWGRAEALIALNKERSAASTESHGKQNSDG